MDLFERGLRFGQLYDALADVEICRDISYESSVSQDRFVNDFARRSKPFVLRPSMSVVSQEGLFEHLVDNFGDQIIRVRYGDYGDPSNYVPERRQLKDLCLREYVALVERSPQEAVPPYAGNFALPASFVSDLGASAPSFYPNDFFEPPTVWLGTTGCITPLHRDSTDNFAFQLLGRKCWTIFPPQEAPLLYMSRVAESKGGDFATSAVDLRDPDFGRFPLFQKTKGIKFQLEAGDMLYLPMGWSHFVETMSQSLMINYWLSVEPIGIAALQSIKQN